MVSNNAFTTFAECDLMLSIMRMESLLKCGIRSFSRYALNTSAAVPPEKVSTVQRSVHLNRWQDGRIFWLGRRNRINCSATAERISISSDHICIISAFVQKHKITYFEFRYTVWPVLPFSATSRMLLFAGVKRFLLTTISLLLKKTPNGIDAYRKI